MPTANVQPKGIVEKSSTTIKTQPKVAFVHQIMDNAAKIPRPSIVTKKILTSAEVKAREAVKRKQDGDFPSDSPVSNYRDNKDTTENNFHGNHDKLRRKKEDKKSVSFAPRVRVFPTTHRKDYTTEEAEAVWGTEEEWERNKDDLVDTVARMRAAFCSEGEEEQEDGTITEDGVKLCTRGLEHMRRPKDSERRQVHKHQVIDAVLNEQERQWLEQIYNSRKLAIASSFWSKASQVKALNSAALDAEYVQARTRSSQLRSLRRTTAMAREPRGSSTGFRRIGHTPSRTARKQRPSRLSFEKHGDAVLDTLLESQKQADREDDENGDEENGEQKTKQSIVSQIDQGFKTVLAWPKKQKGWENLDDEGENGLSGETGAVQKRLGPRHGFESKTFTFVARAG